MPEAVVDSGLDQAKRALARGQLELAWAKASEVARLLPPDDIETSYLCAVILRLQGNLREALQRTEYLAQVYPRIGRVHQERGHCLRSLGQRDAAVGAYEQAVACNPLLTTPWQLLAAHYQEHAPDKVIEAQNKCREIELMPLALRAALAAYYDEDFKLAEERVRAFLMATPDNPVAMRLLAELGARLGEYEDAQFVLEKCKQLNPGYIPARYDLVDVLSKRFHYARALSEAEEVLTSEPDNLQFRMLRANLLLQIGETEAALAEYKTIQRQDETNTRVSLTLGHAYKTLGRIEDAVNAYRHAYRLKRDFGDAYWSLANLKTYRFTDDELVAMATEEGKATTETDDRIHLCFALGKAYEDRADHASAFACYAHGNHLRQSILGYQPDAVTYEVDHQIEHCSQSLFSAKLGSGCTAEDPIFIVGLPRAGSTLLEQILASHSQVEGTTELPDIMAIASRLNGRQAAEEEDRYPANLIELTPAEFSGLGESYMASTRVHRREGKTRFIDKMPNNFRHIGLIHLILPNARIIDARRDPMDCGFSVFRQLFAQGQDFSYDLGHIGRYYRDYVRLMDHWDTVLPGRVLRVQHEDVIDDLEAQVRRILQHCGLPFEQACVDFHLTRRAIRTPSSEQVRRPINRDGAGVWKNFEPWLAPLKSALAGQDGP